MPQRIEFNGTVHEFPDDFTQQEISMALDSTRATPADRSAVARPDARQPNYNRTIPGDLARAGTNALPAVGAMGGMALGSALGGPPGAMLGSAAGSKAGEWGRYALAPSVGLPQNVPPMLGMNDAINAALAGIGVGGAAGARAAAPGMMRTGLKMMPTKREQWLATVAGGETPEQAALRMGVGGLEKASALKAATGRAQGRAILDAEQGGHSITAAELAEPALKQAERESKRVLSIQEQDRIIRRIEKQADELLNDAAMGVKVRTAAGFTPSQVATIKKAAQKIASPKYNQQAQGVNVNVTPDHAMMLAAGARASLARFPNVAARTLENQKARLLTQALSRSEARQQTSLPQLGMGALGAGMGGALGGMEGGALGAGIGAPLAGFAAHTLSSPEAQRHIALLLSSPFAQQAMQYGPLGASILARMLMTPPPQEPQETLPPNPAWGSGYGR